jgi:hypothetical protein
VNGTGPRASALLRFDESPVSAGARIREAFITLTMARKCEGDPGTIRAHRMMADCDLERATCNYVDSANRIRWGADSQSSPKEGQDCEAAASGQADTGGALAGDVLKIDVTAAVRHRVNEPDANYGLLLAAEEGKAGGWFNSSESPDVFHRPRLYVTYTVQLVAAPEDRFQVMSVQKRLAPARTRE